MSKKEFEKEVSMCKDLYHKNQGSCAWGKCVTCGVIPLLYKLHEGTLVEKEDAIKALKKGVFGDDKFL
ncbi:MAG: hypothetical protein WCG73_01640 [Candidatus Moraniibacteriota bacterium]